MARAGVHPVREDNNAGRHARVSIFACANGNTVMMFGAGVFIKWAVVATVQIMFLHSARQQRWPQRCFNAGKRFAFFTKRKY